MTWYKEMQSETADFVPDAATWRTGRNVRVVFDSGLFPALYENIMSSTTPEVRRQRRTEPRPQVTCTENLVKFGPLVFEIRKHSSRQINKQTNKQTYRHTKQNTSHPYRGRHKICYHVSLVVTALDLRLHGREFDSWPPHCRVTTLGKLFTLMCLCYQAV